MSLSCERSRQDRGSISVEPWSPHHLACSTCMYYYERSTKRFLDTEGGQPKIIIRRGKSFMYKKEPKEPIFCSGQLEPTWRGPVAGGVLIYTHVGGYGFRIPLCTCDFFSWLLVRWGASRSARKKASCARPHWRKLRVWGLAAGRLFFPIFFDAGFAVYNARRLLGSKTWISATSHRQGPRMVSEARNACFGITGARNRPIPTLLPSETCTQTPLDRPKMLLRRDPDFADAPDVKQGLV